MACRFLAWPGGLPGTVCVAAGLGPLDGRRDARGTDGRPLAPASLQGRGLTCDGVLLIRRLAGCSGVGRLYRQLDPIRLRGLGWRGGRWRLFLLAPVVEFANPEVDRLLPLL